MQPRTVLNVMQLVLVALLVVVIADVAGLTLRKAPPPSTTVAPPVVASSAPSLTERQSIDRSISLLGKADDVTKPPSTKTPDAAGGDRAASPAPSAAPAPEPGAQMTLLGTIVSPGASVAVIQVNGQETTVHEKDTVGTPAFTVARIRDDSVLMVIDGQRRTLRLPSFQPPTAGGAAPAPPPPAAPVAAPPPPPPVAPQPPSIAPLASPAPGGPLSGERRKARDHTRPGRPGPEAPGPPGSVPQGPPGQP